MLVSQVMHFVEPSRKKSWPKPCWRPALTPPRSQGLADPDLAAHLYLRERKARVGLGLLIKRLSKASDQATAELAATIKTPEAYAKLVNTFRAGPPALSPMRIKALDESSNLIEYFVHTEDVRRAVDRWAPRALDGPTPTRSGTNWLSAPPFFTGAWTWASSS